MGYYIVENEHATNYRNLVLDGLDHAEAVAEALGMDYREYRP